MKTSLANHPTSRQEFVKLFQQTITTNRFIFGFLGLQFLIFMALGFAIWLLSVGLFYGFWKMALTFDPPYQVLIKISRAAGVAGLPAHLIPPPFGQVVYSCVSMVFPALFIVIGIIALQNVGFCTQNVICAVGQLVFR